MTTDTELRDQLAAEAGGPTRGPAGWDDIVRRGRHRRRVRRAQNLAVLALVGGVAATAIALSADDPTVDTGPPATQPTVPAVIDPSTVRRHGDAQIEGARAQGTSLTLFFGDPALCRNLRPVIRETDDEITVGLVGAQDERGVPWAGCGGGERGELDPWGTIELSAPAGDRSLVDLSTGQAVPVKDGTDLLFPTSLPAPFDVEVFDQDQGGLLAGPDDWIFRFPAGESQFVRLSSSADPEANGSGCSGQVVEVRGTDGCFEQGGGTPALTWDEDGRAIYLSVVSPNIEGSILDELLAIAEGLRPLGP